MLRQTLLITIIPTNMLISNMLVCQAAIMLITLSSSSPARHLQRWVEDIAGGPHQQLHLHPHIYHSDAEKSFCLKKEYFRL